jgi:hypothetical protein
MYALGLTKFLFMHYFLVDKSKNSDLEVFNYKKILERINLQTLHTSALHVH